MYTLAYVEFTTCNHFHSLYDNKHLFSTLAHRSGFSTPDVIAEFRRVTFCWARCALNIYQVWRSVILLQHVAVIYMLETTRDT